MYCFPLKIRTQIVQLSGTIIETKTKFPFYEFVGKTSLSISFLLNRRYGRTFLATPAFKGLELLEKGVGIDR